MGIGEQYTNLYRQQIKYPSCQLIAAINARIWLGSKDISDDLFEYLVDLTRCRYGGAIGVQIAYPILGLHYEDGPLNIAWIEKHLPVNVTIHDPIKGFHSVLVEKVTFEGKVVQPILHLVNYKGNLKETLTWMQFHEILPLWDHQQRCRSFRLKK